MSSLRERLSTGHLALRRSVLRRRRLLAAVLTAIGTLAVLQALAAPAPPSERVTVAAHDLASGTVLSAADLTTVEFAPDAVPDGTVEQPTGETVAAPVKAGEPITEPRLVGPELTAGEGAVAIPIRLPDAGMVDLLRVGDRIDLVATDAQEGGAVTIAEGVRVLAIPRQADSATGNAGLPGRLIVVGAEPIDVPKIAEQSVRAFMTYAWSDG